jgi:transcriptional regulator with XRE-family HTH domain
MHEQPASQARMVAALAAARGLSARDIAHHLGVTPPALTRALQGGLRPMAETTGACSLEAVAAALGAPVEALLPGGVVLMRVVVPGGEP